MRITTGPGTPSAVAGRREAGRAAPAGSPFGPAAPDGGAVSAARVADAGPAPPLTSLDALVALQAPSDEKARRRRRAVRRGEALLDRLDETRTALLDGSLPVAILQDLRAGLDTGRKDIDDPRLSELLREIEVRAAVEVAKLEREGLVG